MKFLFDHSAHDPKEHDWGCHIGVHWYKHNPISNKYFKPWKGFTVVFYLLKWRFYFTWVDDYAAYRYRMNYRSTAHIRKKFSKNDDQDK